MVYWFQNLLNHYSCRHCVVRVIIILEILASTQSLIAFSFTVTDFDYVLIEHTQASFRIGCRDLAKYRDISSKFALWVWQMHLFNHQIFKKTTDLFQRSPRKVWFETMYQIYVFGCVLHTGLPSCGFNNSQQPGMQFSLLYFATLRRVRMASKRNQSREYSIQLESNLRDKNKNTKNVGSNITEGNIKKR